MRPASRDLRDVAVPNHVLTLQRDAAHEVAPGRLVVHGIEALVVHRLGRDVSATGFAMLAERVEDPLRQLAMPEIG